MSFTSFDFRPELLKSLTELGYETPTPIQTQTIPLLLAGHDVIGCAQTGTGKTAAFALPILQHLEPGLPGPQALIITPTRELAEQIDQNIKAYAKRLKVRCQSVYGGVNINPQETQLRRGVDIVVATPGRLLDHLQRGSLRLNRIKYLVLDEADRMLDMGFLPDIKRILKHVPSERQTLLFSATMPKEIEDLVNSLTRDAKSVNVAPRNATADSVEQLVYPVEKTNKLRLLMHLLETQSMYSVIVFSRTRHGADRIARQLGKQGIEVARIHADRSQNQRQQALDGFKSGKYQVLVATDIAARGIDVENISHVINFDTPTHAEDYVHRIGRTGRAAATGDAFTFTSPEEDKYLKAIEKLIGRRLPLANPAEYQAKIKPGPETAPVTKQVVKPPSQQRQAHTKLAQAKQSQAKQAAQSRSENRSQQKSGQTQKQGQTVKQAQSPERKPQLAAKGAPKAASKQEKAAPKPEKGGRSAQAPKQAVQKQGQKAAQPAARSQQPLQKPAQKQAQGQKPLQGAKSQGRQEQLQGAKSQGRQEQPARQSQNDRPAQRQQGVVSRGSGGSLRVVKRSMGSYPLSGEVDYIDLDEEQSSNDRQPQNLDAGQWGYPRNPVYEPWKQKDGQGRAKGDDQSRGRRRR